MDAALPTLAAVGTDRPLLTYLDGRTGERTELTAAELGDWAARAAGLLRDGCGLGPGSRVAVLLPPHWRTAAVLLGAWSVGLEVSFRPRATAGLSVLEPGGDRPYDAVLVTPERLDDWLEDVPDGLHRYLVGTGPEPLAEVPIGWLDWSVEVLRHGAAPADRPMLYAADPATPDGTSYAEWGQVAREMAEQLDLRVGDRLLVDAAEHDQPLKWLLAPLAAGATVVLAANLDPAVRHTLATTEQITRTL
ncbi:TIGR03089 family protein [Micromonospora endophytica]|uniref:AMP-dependent synthetase n=1 Tax=Micromonospora endophytica TaxID=515350 RepID=A0A2W2DAW2_9ACTN|nr:TIGR03089 family protein [Micromonospora endophytica]PZF97037.1 AMP-dependent synthetase [Micromonospora endophytica]RIW40501.1 AMP-dependent synthetase [Micromonospora endophytica]BCJ58930.1 TIGR03089 family protein [Micromonospora endophytica]